MIIINIKNFFKVQTLPIEYRHRSICIPPFDARHGEMQYFEESFRMYN